MNVRATGRMAAKTLLYFLVTTIICAILGVSLAIAIHPGDPAMLEELRAGQTEVSDADDGTDSNERKGTTLDAFMDIFRQGKITLFSSFEHMFFT